MVPRRDQMARIAPPVPPGYHRQVREMGFRGDGGGLARLTIYRPHGCRAVAARASECPPHCSMIPQLKSPQRSARAFLVLAGLAFSSSVTLPAQPADAPTGDPARASAESEGTLEGTVYNGASGLPISRARVRVQGTDQEVLTDDEGNFRFRR